MILFYDFEVFKYDWLVCIGDVEHRSMHTIANSRGQLQKFYDKNKDNIWVGFNSRHYDSIILKSILIGLNPYDVSQDLIMNGKKGFEISSLFNKIQLYNYDCKPNQFSLKKLEGFMGSSIVESSIPFDIDRKLNADEMKEVERYCKHDVRQTFNVFKNTISTFNSHVKLMREFDMPMSKISKTSVGLTADILGANRVDRDDEFDIVISDKLQLGKYEYIKTRFLEWSKQSNIDKENGVDKKLIYDNLNFTEKIAGIDHIFAAGGLHAAIPKYCCNGKYLLIDVESYYPIISIEYKLLSRNVKTLSLYKDITENRLNLKKIDKDRANCLKIPLNGSYGACKHKHSKMYDPRNATSVCINGQLFLVDLLKDLELICKVIQTNTDGILVKIENDQQELLIKSVCEDWTKRTKFKLDFDYFTHIVQRDVNNYIAWRLNADGEVVKLKRKGSYKKRTKIDNQLSIVNDAILKYVMNGVSVEETIKNCDSLIEFQMVQSIGSTYKWFAHNGEILNERCLRIFASKDNSDTSVFKKHIDEKNCYKVEKLAGAPIHSFIDNGDIVDKKVPEKLDKSWYIIFAKYQLSLLLDCKIDGLSGQQWLSKLKFDYEKGTGSHKLNSKVYNKNKDKDILVNMLGKNMLKELDKLRSL